MILNIKSTIKHFGISIVTFCAVLISTLFINYYLDIIEIEDKLTNPIQTEFYNGQVTSAKMLSIVCFSVLMLTSVILLIFYIKQYIDSNKKELGILKAIGYKNIEIANSFWLFGLNVLIGSVVGYLAASLMMGEFYKKQNESGIIPDFDPTFHAPLFICAVLVPAILMGVIAILYAVFALNRPVLGMLKESINCINVKKVRDNTKNKHFLSDLKTNTLRTNKVLVFLIFFSAFCFAAISQASFGVRDYASDMMGIMILVIGLILSVTMMFISISTVVRDNRRTIGMMRAMGYDEHECYKATLGCYRPFAYVGFVIGTVYQYALMKIMIDSFFSDYSWFEPYELDKAVLVISIIMFAAFYELFMVCFSKSVKRISIKEIMLDE